MCRHQDGDHRRFLERECFALLIVEIEDQRTHDPHHCHEGWIPINKFHDPFEKESSQKFEHVFYPPAVSAGSKAISTLSFLPRNVTAVLTREKIR